MLPIPPAPFCALPAYPILPAPHRQRPRVPAPGAAWSPGIRRRPVMSGRYNRQQGYSVQRTPSRLKAPTPHPAPQLSE